MLRLVGHIAHSGFRLSPLLASLQSVLPNLSSLKTHYEYFLECTEEVTEKEANLLKDILAAHQESPISKEDIAMWVVPRFGTHSAWGSKALDILKNVGLTKIKKIERAVVYHLIFTAPTSLQENEIVNVLPLIHDRMTESVTTNWQAVAKLFDEHAPQPLTTIAILEKGKPALETANTSMGLALSSDEIDYLDTQYRALKRNPTDVELMMFAQANSEHCRHKIFKAQWEIDGQAQADTLFGMIKNTYEHNSKGVLSAYHDNSSVVTGFGQKRFYCDADNTYRLHDENVHLLMKVETHNHPTAIEPFSGAGTGMGGEIRDEGATGMGAKPKAGLCGFSVSDLHIPEFAQPWEGKAHYPSRISTALDIMLKAPIGGAAFNNEFGRPNLCGYFRTFEQAIASDKTYLARGYHKPIMIAGGMGNIAENHVKKQAFPAGSCLIVLGGSALKIGLGGGAASSMAAGQSLEELDFASVQRQNPEMQRRCQEVIDRCWALGDNNPLLSIHDVGAGGLANALPELVHDVGLGASLLLRNIPNAELSMTPMEIWCNESQERYVLAIDPKKLSVFEDIAKRERCPFAVLGHATITPQLTVYDEQFDNKAIDIPQALLFGNPPKVFKKVVSKQIKGEALRTDFALPDIATRVLQHPSVADKSFLITIGDRTVTGLVARDQMVGPWQVPVADCAVTATNFVDVTGEAMSMGERAPIAVLNPAASAKMAVAEAVLNLLAADVASLSDIRLSCNWMAAANQPGEDVALYAAVKAVGVELCPAWDITIPVGKDSLSMRTAWQDNLGNYEVISPVTLVVSAFAPVKDIRQTLTPYVDTQEKTKLIFIDLANNQKRLGGSIFAQVTSQLGQNTPNVDDPNIIKHFVVAINQIKSLQLVNGYHDRSDGGLFTTLCEIAFANHLGLSIDLSGYVSNWENEGIDALFNEESGVVISILEKDFAEVKAIFAQNHLGENLHEIAVFNQSQQIEIHCFDKMHFSAPRNGLQSDWSKTSFMMQSLRDNPDCALQAFKRIEDDSDLGLQAKITHDITHAPMINTGIKPKVAILREQGVNGHLEMAGAFTLAGFEAIDVTMSDLLSGVNLASFQVLAACGGFSYGDVLGAGKGWANTILFQPQLSALFAAFFERKDTLTLGVCNGCQMLSSLKSLIPGAQHWPRFIKNKSEQFEARVSLVEVCKSPSIFLKNLEGSILPIAVSHGEGYADFSQDSSHQAQAMMALRYVNSHTTPTEEYPFNPNGSPQGLTGLTTLDGRATIMMPHPERVFKSWQLSWHPKEWGEDSPWMTLFTNARNWMK